MDYVGILQSLAAKWPVLMIVFMLLGSLVVLGQIIVPLTPTKKDDAAWAKIKAVPLVGPLLAALELFAPFQKKQ